MYFKPILNSYRVVCNYISKRSLTYQQKGDIFWSQRKGLETKGLLVQGKIINYNQLPSRNYLQLCNGKSRQSNFLCKPAQKNYQISQRNFRTTKPNNVAPFVVVVASRLAKFGAALLGRGVRKWWANLPPEQKAIYLERARRNRKYVVALLTATGGTVYFYYDTHLQVTPFTNRKRFVAFSPDQFDILARKEFDAMIAQFKEQIVPATLSNPMYSRVTGVANRLLQANKDLPQIKQKQWTITVVKDDTVQNAFVLPCGNIFVFSGMLDVCDDNDELGVILGHEMAHAVLGHGAENASYLHLMDLILVLPVAFLWFFLPTDASAALFHWIGESVHEIMLKLPYARAMEIEADEVGLLLAAKACFDVRAAPVFWSKMSYASGKEGEPQIEWLSTHPSHESRENLLEEVLPRALAVREDCQCPKLPFMDPRQRLAAYKKKIASAETFDNVAIRLRV